MTLGRHEFGLLGVGAVSVAAAAFTAGHGVGAVGAEAGLAVLTLLGLPLARQPNARADDDATALPTFLAIHSHRPPDRAQARGDGRPTRPPHHGAHRARPGCCAGRPLERCRQPGSPDEAPEPIS